MDANQGNNFLDRKTIIAIIVTGVIFIGWQKYIAMKYPSYGKGANATKEVTGNQAEVAKPVSSSAAVTSSVAVTGGTPSQNADVPPSQPVATAKEFAFETNEYSAVLTSQGMGLKSIVLKGYKGRDLHPIKWEGNGAANLFDVSIQGRPVEFDVTQSGSGDLVEFSGTAHINGMTIHRTLKFNPLFYVQSEVDFENPFAGFNQFEIRLADRVSEAAPSSGIFMSSSTDIQEVIGNGDKDVRVKVSGLKQSLIDDNQGLRNGFSIASHYFAAAYVNQAPIAPELHTDARIESSSVVSTGIYKLTSLQDKMAFAGVGYFGPKDLTIIDKITAATKADFEFIVNFGFFGVIGKVLLKVLQFFHSALFPNWGVAVIFLTLAVRIIVLPFNITSFKSMKKMQKIQPQLTALRERYKGDPQTMQSETMRLMKENKANPLGGCIPMLLQMPIFFAFNSVLGQSIELYQQPFFGWIQDLSLRDPYFITPVLLAGAMWYNQKITPTASMDPNQAKVLQWMPLIFGAMMVALPSALTLYILVSTLSGIAQQRIFMRDRTATA